ncbi:MAG TPA: hypothetical protein VGJ07_07365 [Rugosimonospora sp.]|jgi:hypothetical protein
MYDLDSCQYLMNHGRAACQWTSSSARRRREGRHPMIAGRGEADADPAERDRVRFLSLVDKTRRADLSLSEQDPETRPPIGQGLDRIYGNRSKHHLS